MKVRIMICCATIMIAGFTTATKGQSESKTETSKTIKQEKGSADTAFIRKNIRDNMNEIRMSELAINRDVLQNIKNVAIVIRDDHNQMLNDILTYAKEANITGVMETEMNISTDTMGQMNASSGNKGVLTRNRRDDAQSADESRNTAKKSKATQQADAGKPSGNRRGTGFDHSREQQAAGDSSTKQVAGGSAEQSEAEHMEHMSALEKASGDEFISLWTDQMITMHEKKLQELRSAQQTIGDAALKTQITNAIPKIEKHLELLKKIK